MDELIRDYLVYRGFSQALKSFDNDLKNEKEKAFRPDRLVLVAISPKIHFFCHFSMNIFNSLSQDT